jgi:hypothetical protein
MARDGRTVVGDVARVLGGVALLVVGAVHYQQYAGEHFSAIPTIGTLFLLNFASATVLGLLLIAPIGLRPRRVPALVDGLAALGGIGVSAGALAALLISEHTPLFGFMEQGYRLAIVIAIASEAAAVVLLAAFLATTLRRRRRAGARGSARRRARPDWRARRRSTPAVRSR